MSLIFKRQNITFDVLKIKITLWIIKKQNLLIEIEANFAGIIEENLVYIN